MIPLIDTSSVINREWIDSKAYFGFSNYYNLYACPTVWSFIKASGYHR